MRNVDTTDLSYFVKSTQADTGIIYRREAGCLGGVGLLLRTSPNLDAFFDSSHLNWYFGYEERCTMEVSETSKLRPVRNSSEISKIAKIWDIELFDGSDIVLVGLTSSWPQPDLDSAGFRENLRELDESRPSCVEIVIYQTCDELVTSAFFNPLHEQLIKDAMVDAGCTNFIDKDYRKCRPKLHDLFLR